MKKLLLATRNKGKIEEFHRILEEIAPGEIELVGLDQYPDLADVEETGSTFQENALLKAHQMSAATGLPAIADDSGFEMAADYETFKSIYDSSPIIQNLVKDFNADGITLNVPGTDKDTQTPVKQGQTSQDAVDKAAASAAPQQLAAQA
jgi:hypothetical protein